MEFFSLWDEAASDLESENRERAVHTASIASAGVWAFLAAAKSEPEFNTRLALAESNLSTVAAESGLSVEDVTDIMRRRYALLLEASDNPFAKDDDSDDDDSDDSGSDSDDDGDDDDDDDSSDSDDDDSDSDDSDSDDDGDDSGDDDSDDSSDDDSGNPFAKDSSLRAQASDDEDEDDEEEGGGHCEDCGAWLDEKGLCPSCLPNSERNEDEKADGDAYWSSKRGEVGRHGSLKAQIEAGVNPLSPEFGKVAAPAAQILMKPEETVRNLGGGSMGDLMDLMPQSGQGEEIEKESAGAARLVTMIPKAVKYIPAAMDVAKGVMPNKEQAPAAAAAPAEHPENGGIPANPQDAMNGLKEKGKDIAKQILASEGPGDFEYGGKFRRPESLDIPNEYGHIPFHTPRDVDPDHSPDAGQVHITDHKNMANGKHNVMVIDANGNSQWPIRYDNGSLGFDNPHSIVTPHHVIHDALDHAEELDKTLGTRDRTAMLKMQILAGVDPLSPDFGKESAAAAIPLLLRAAPLLMGGLGGGKSEGADEGDEPEGVLEEGAEAGRLPFAEGAKSNTCPQCGDHMSDVVVNGDTLTANCGGCGWSGSKTKKTSARDWNGETTPTEFCNELKKYDDLWNTGGREHDSGCPVHGGPNADEAFSSWKAHVSKQSSKIAMGSQCPNCGSDKALVAVPSNIGGHAGLKWMCQGEGCGWSGAPEEAKMNRGDVDKFASAGGWPEPSETGQEILNRNNPDHPDYNDFDSNTWHEDNFGGMKTTHVMGHPVHTFPSTRQAYNESQTNDNIKDGDVLSVPSENVHGYLHQAWPVATHHDGDPGEFHTAKPGHEDEMLAENSKYPKAHAVAAQLHSINKTGGAAADLGATTNTSGIPQGGQPYGGGSNQATTKPRQQPAGGPGGITGPAGPSGPDGGIAGPGSPGDDNMAGGIQNFNPSSNGGDAKAGMDDMPDSNAPTTKDAVLVRVARENPDLNEAQVAKVADLIAESSGLNYMPRRSVGDSDWTKSLDRNLSQKPQVSQTIEDKIKSRTQPYIDKAKKHVKQQADMRAQQIKNKVTGPGEESKVPDGGGFDAYSGPYDDAVDLSDYDQTVPIGSGKHRGTGTSNSSGPGRHRAAALEADMPLLLG